MSVIIKDSIGQDVQAGDTVVYRGPTGLRLARITEIHVRSWANSSKEIVWVTPVVAADAPWRERAARCVGDFAKVTIASPVEEAK